MSNVGKNTNATPVTLYNSGLDKLQESRDKAIKNATSFGIGPVRIPKLFFSDDKAVNKAYDQYQRSAASFDSMFNMLMSAMDRNAGRNQ